MECPRTGKPMETIDIAGVTVEVSTGCGGIWFNNFELQKFDEEHESAGDELIALSEKYRDDSIDTSPRLKCPHHADVTMLRHFFTVKQKVEIDECPQCGGIWLDPGELKAIRDLFPSEEARNQAADEYFETLLKSPEMTALKSQEEEGLRKARRFANMFKFICPSYYVPGDQSWGAF